MHKENINHDSYKYSIGYIDGELDGLVLKTLLKNNLFNFKFTTKSLI